MCINGAAAHLVSPGDVVIIVCYVQMDRNAAINYNPKIVLLDEKNEIK